MTQHGTTGMAPAPPLPLPVRTASEPSGSFAGIAALGAAFAGLLSYGRNPDLLTTAFAVGITFLGALIVLHVLHLAFRMAVALGKVAIPVAAILLIGCALNWPWAETAVDWLRVVGGHGVEAAERGWMALRAR